MTLPGYFIASFPLDLIRCMCGLPLCIYMCTFSKYLVHGTYGKFMQPMTIDDTLKGQIFKSRKEAKVRNRERRKERKKEEKKSGVEVGRRKGRKKKEKRENKEKKDKEEKK